MTSTVLHRLRGVLPAAALPFLLLAFFTPFPVSAAEPFPGYPEEVRTQALRLIDMAVPGRVEEMEPEILSLRKTMLEYAIVSLNEVPDLVFERARKEGWEGEAADVLRPVTRIAPFSVALWAWLVREDVSTLDIAHLIKDLEGIEGALQRYGPSLLGCAAWLLLFLVATASWGAIWSSVSLLLRAQPALTSDFARLFKRFPRPEIFAFVFFLGCLLFPILAGFGLGVAAVFWFVLSAGYLRRWELATAIASILFLGAAVLCGGTLQSFAKFTGETRRGGWLGGEGYFPQEWPKAESSPGDPFNDSRWGEMVRFARARAEMQAGDFEAAEALWTEWIRNARDAAPGYNNRGIARFRQGNTEGAVSDFEAAVSRNPRGGPAYWNSYQMYLQSFRLEDAARVQEAAWASLRDLALFDYRAEEMTQGELLPSPLRLRGAWKDLFTPRLGWLSGSVASPVHRFLFRPLPGKWIPVFLVGAMCWMLLWKSLSGKVWMHGTCRSCGVRTLVIGGPESTDICNQCKAQIGGGIRAGEEREHRLLSITMHRRYVAACSFFLPGSGAFWAGKGVFVAFYGLALSLALGLVTVSLGVGNAVPSLISHMLGGVELAGLAAVAVLWGVGAAWSWKSFCALQAKYNISPRR